MEWCIGEAVETRDLIEAEMETRQDRTSTGLIEVVVVVVVVVVDGS